MKFEFSVFTQIFVIYNSRNLLMKFEQEYAILKHFIYNSRNLLMKFEATSEEIILPSTTVEIY